MVTGLNPPVFSSETSVLPSLGAVESDMVCSFLPVYGSSALLVQPMVSGLFTERHKGGHNKTPHQHRCGAKIKTRGA